MLKVFVGMSCVAAVLGMQNFASASEPRGEVKYMFKALDKDSDKRLTYQEFLGKRSDESGKYRKQFDYADKDNDLRMSYDEFRAVMERYR